jgi:hypothetical protein
MIFVGWQAAPLQGTLLKSSPTPPKNISTVFGMSMHKKMAYADFDISH